MSNEPMKISVNYAETAEMLTKVLGLKCPPVALNSQPQWNRFLPVWKNLTRPSGIV